MAKNSKGPYIAILIFALLVAAGFYFVFENFADLREDFKDFEFAFEVYKKESAVLKAVELPKEVTPASSPAPAPEIRESATIPTAILFQAKSSPLLEPQVDLNISIESVTRALNGTIEIAVKVFNGGAQNYSALDPIPLFEIIDLQNPSANQEPYKIEGAYDSIPPKSAVLGKIFFKLPALQNTMILRTGPVDNSNFYEFNFSKKTYKETTVG